jgi:hypothetical protein
MLLERTLTDSAKALSMLEIFSILRRQGKAIRSGQDQVGQVDP